MTETQVLMGIIAIFVSFGCGVVGIAIGFYKCKADLSELYVSKSDCEGCSVKKELIGINESMRDASEELKKGSKTFTVMKVSLAVIAEELKAKDKIQSILKSMGITDT